MEQHCQHTDLARCATSAALGIPPLHHSPQPSLPVQAVFVLESLALLLVNASESRAEVVMPSMGGQWCTVGAGWLVILAWR